VPGGRSPARNRDSGQEHSQPGVEPDRRLSRLPVTCAMALNGRKTRGRPAYLR
jgi:hypothetical protein